MECVKFLSKLQWSYMDYKICLITQEKFKTKVDEIYTITNVLSEYI